MKILYVRHDMMTWQAARVMSWSMAQAWSRVLTALGHEVTVLPTVLWPWARDIVAGQRFDMVWINECIHVTGERDPSVSCVRLQAADFAWLRTLADEVVGYVCESLFYSPQVYAEVPELGRRVAILEAAVLPHVTAMVHVDEADGAWLEAKGVRAFWCPEHVHDALVAPMNLPAPPTGLEPGFLGSVYGQRYRFLQASGRAESVRFWTSGEHGTELPALFDELQHTAMSLAVSRPHDAQTHQNYLQAFDEIRLRCYEKYLQTLAGMGLVMNLPSFFQGYPMRVYEALYLGRPVLTWDIPDRPRTGRLLLEQHGVLRFDRDRPEQFGALLDSINARTDEVLLAAQDGAKRVRWLHTTEHRTFQLLEWLQTGRAPDYDTVE